MRWFAPTVRGVEGFTERDQKNFNPTPGREIIYLDACGHFHGVLSTGTYINDSKIWSDWDH